MLVSEKVSELLYRFDPMRLRSPHADEYEHEARIISDLLEEAETPEELQLIIRETFVERFGEKVVGHPDKFARITVCVWGLRRQRNNFTPGS